jgi:hypothetical protein
MLVCLGIVSYKEAGVPGRTKVAVGNHRKVTDDDVLQLACVGVSNEAMQIRCARASPKTIAGRLDSVVELERLIAKLLAKLKSLGHREYLGKFCFPMLLFLVDLRPLGLIA